jgi:hypothetical protein
MTVHRVSPRQRCTENPKIGSLEKSLIHANLGYMIQNGTRMKERELKRERVVERGEEIELFPPRLVPQTHPNHKVYQTLRTMILIDIHGRLEWSFKPFPPKTYTWLYTHSDIHRSISASRRKLKDTPKRVA